MESLSDLPTVTQLESSEDQNSKQAICPGSNHPCLLPLSAPWMFPAAGPLTDSLMVHDSSVLKGGTDSPAVNSLEAFGVTEKKLLGKAPDFLVPLPLRWE